MAEKQVFRTLDALRGVAAIAVVTFHGRELFGPLHLPSAHLAVDLFFCLSGFVLAHAYGERLSTGMSLSRFLQIRLVRLFPLYIVGALIGGSYVLVQMALHAPSLAEDHVSALTALNLAMLPSVGTESLYPIDPPAWSLFYELAANVAMFLWWRHLTNLRLIGLVMVAAVALLAGSYLHGGLDLGSKWEWAWVAIARVSFSFFLGVLLYRLKLRTWSVPSWALVGAIAVLFAVPGGAWRWAYDATAVCVLMPALVVLGANGMGSWRTFDVAGRISYAVYVIHMPLLMYVRGGLKMTHMTLPPIVTAPVFVLATVVVALSADVLIDIPVRSVLARALQLGGRRQEKGGATRPLNPLLSRFPLPMTEQEARTDARRSRRSGHALPDGHPYAVAPIWLPLKWAVRAEKLRVQALGLEPLGQFQELRERA